MAGFASKELRSSYVSEVTAGTTPSTPAFKTQHAPIIMKASPVNERQASLVSGGAPLGLSKVTVPVTGTQTGDFVYSVYDDQIASCLQSAWATNVVSDAKLFKPGTVENKLLAGMGGTATYLRYRGVDCTGFKWMAEAGKPMTFSATYAGMISDDATTSAISGATYTDPANRDPFSSNFDVGAITAAGYTLDAISRMEIDLAYDGRDPQSVIGTDVAAGVTRGALNAKITARFLVDANFLATYNAARSDHATFKTTINIGSETGKKYKFEFWDTTWNIADPDWTGSTAYVDVEIIPHYSPSNSCVLTLTRALS